MWTAQHFIEGTYSGRLEPMLLRPGMSPQDHLLTDLIVHVATVVQYNRNKLLTLFHQMINNPEQLKVHVYNVYISLFTCCRMCFYPVCQKIPCL